MKNKIVKYQSIKLTAEFHKILKDYANENSLKLNDWCEKLLKKEFEKILERK